MTTDTPSTPTPYLDEFDLHRAYIAEPDILHRILNADLDPDDPKDKRRWRELPEQVFQIHPQGHRLLAVVDEVPDETAGGIAIPASARNAMKMGIATTISAGPLAGRGLDSRYPFAPICHPSQLVYRRVIIGEHVGKAVRMSFQDDTHSSAIILMTALDIQAVIYTPIPGVDPDAA